MSSKVVTPAKAGPPHIRRAERHTPGALRLSCGGGSPVLWRPGVQFVDAVLDSVPIPRDHRKGQSPGRKGDGFRRNDGVSDLNDEE